MEEGNRMEDFEFMEEILEKRSIIEESNDKKEINAIKLENSQIIEASFQKIMEKLEKSEYQEALELLEKHQYYDKIDQAISAWEEKQNRLQN